MTNTEELEIVYTEVYQLLSGVGFREKGGYAGGGGAGGNDDVYHRYEVVTLTLRPLPH